jgi:tetratricopeptide (TPR) repeat protein
VLIDPDLAIERKRLADGLGTVTRLSLATVEEETVSVHRLLQKVVRDDARARGDQTPISRVLAAVDHAFPTDPSDPTQWPRSEQLLSHVIALADAAARIEGAPQLIGLLNRASEYQALAEGSTRALVLAERTIGASESVLGPAHPSGLKARQIAAFAMIRLGRPQDASARFETLLADQERILGPRHGDTLTTRHLLAHAYNKDGRGREAIASLEALLADRERILGAEHPDTLATRHDLALAYTAAGRLREAIAILKPLLVDQERILGPEHPTTRRTRQNLATAVRATRRVGKAAVLSPRPRRGNER